MPKAQQPPLFLTAALALGGCGAIAVLCWFGFRTSWEWQQSSRLLAQRRADDAVMLLATALRKDMRGVHTSILSVSDWEHFVSSSHSNVNTTVASAFARYPYPDAFVSWQGNLPPEQMVFFTRSERPPRWASPDDQGSHYPVLVQTQPAIATAIARSLQSDIAAHRTVSVFEVKIQDAVYQVVTRLWFRNEASGQLEGMCGFMVDLAWVRDHYFPQLSRQVIRIGPDPRPLTFSILDESGKPVVGTPDRSDQELTSHEPLQVMFFDPSLLPINRLSTLPQRIWTLHVSSAQDPALADAARGARLTLVVTTGAAIALVLGLAFTVRAVRVSAKLADRRATFASSVTHELKTPIANIIALGDTLASHRLNGPGSQHKYATAVVHEAKRLARWVDNLLALDRLGNAAALYTFEPVPLDVFVVQSFAAFEQQLARGAVMATSTVPEDLPLVRADRTALELVIDNLVDNAIRFSRQGQTIEVSARRDGRMVDLYVTDHGRGIPSEELSQVTRKMFRGHNSGPGTGLGLTIVEQIVKDHGGSLLIQSKAGEGTTVRVTLPVA